MTRNDSETYRVKPVALKRSGPDGVNQAVHLSFQSRGNPAKARQDEMATAHWILYRGGDLNRTTGKVRPDTYERVDFVPQAHSSLVAADELDGMAFAEAVERVWQNPAYVAITGWSNGGPLGKGAINAYLLEISEWNTCKDCAFWLWDSERISWVDDAWTKVRRGHCDNSNVACNSLPDRPACPLFAAAIGKPVYTSSDEPLIDHPELGGHEDDD